MRDSIALLDQLSVLNSKKEAISVDDINNLLGRLSFNSLTDLFVSISNSNQNDALNILNTIYNQGNEPVQILSNLLEYMRNALIIKSAQGAENSVIQLNSEQVKTLKTNIDKLEVHQIISLIDKCANYIKELKLTSNPKLWLDVAILDMANLSQNTKLEDLQKRISLLENGNTLKLVNASPYNTPPSPVKKTEVMKPAITKHDIAKQDKSELIEKKSQFSEEEVLTDAVPLSKPIEKNALKDLWLQLLDNVSSFPSRAILKQQAIPLKISEDEVIITIKNQNWLKQFGQDGSKHSFIVDAANKLFSGGVKKVIVRAPSPSDKMIKNEQPEEENDSPAPASVEKKIEKSEEINNEIVMEAIEVKSKAEQSSSQSHSHKNSDEFYHSDEVNMVMDLFEGKIIE